MSKDSGSSNQNSQGYKFIGLNENFRGRALSSWMSEWVQWAHSHSVTYNGRFGEVLFIRGNLSYMYKFTGGPRIQIDADAPFKDDVYITPKVPVYVNVRTSFYFLGEPHPYGSLNTLGDVMGACRDDHCHSTTNKAQIKKLVNTENLNDDVNVPTPLTFHYVEAFGINIRVDPNSQLADQFEFPVERGSDLIGCAVGEVCIIESLKPGEYLIETSNMGARGYKSGSEYRIHVSDRRSVSEFV